MRLILRILAGLVLLGISGASGATLTTLYSFCAKANCADGKAPLDGVIQDASGNLYGTTAAGGSHATVSDSGTAFELVKSGSSWTHKVLHDFCSEPNCTDGSRPFAGLIRDAAGNLYGTATSGGANNGGVAFELSPHGKSWQLKVLYDFCAGANCSDGGSPLSLTYAGAASGVPYDGVSPLYGVTTAGGANQVGTVFALTQTAGSWSEAVLYSFCSVADCSDGWIPEAGLLVDGQGNLFGTTTASNVAAIGSSGGSGVVFELTKGSGDTWSETVLHNFCPTGPCKDAMDPASVLVMDGADNLYGTGQTGGGHHSSGAVFKIDGATSQESVLYSFCALSKCPDGRGPSTDMVMDASGNLFGATGNGGVHAATAGVIFELNGSYQVVYEFCSVKRCKDGALPQGHVAMDGTGNLFGTTRRGGLHGGSDPRNEDAGTVYELTP